MERLNRLSTGLIGGEGLNPLTGGPGNPAAGNPLAASIPGMATPMPGSDDVAAVLQESRYGILIGDTGLLYDGSMPVEVAEPVAVSPLPNVPHWILGMVNLRGNLIPLFDLKVYLGMVQHSDVFTAPQAGHATGRHFRSNLRFLVFGEGNRMAAIIIEQLPSRQSFVRGSGQDDSDLLPFRLKQALTKVYRIGGKEWYEINFDRLFAGMGDITARAGV